MVMYPIDQNQPKTSMLILQSWESSLCVYNVNRSFVFIIVLYYIDIKFAGLFLVTHFFPLF